MPFDDNFNETTNSIHKATTTITSKISSTISLQQEFDFDAVFGDNMVLQHGSQAAIYGFLGSPCKGVELYLYRHDDLVQQQDQESSPSTSTNTHLIFHTKETLMNATLQPFGKGWGKRPCFKKDCHGKNLFPFNPWNQPLRKWKTFLPSQTPGGNYTIEAHCLEEGGEEEVEFNVQSDDPNSTNSTTTTPTITSTTSNPTTTKIISITNITFGDIWFCSGQSNMGLPLQYTFDRNTSIQAILQIGNNSTQHSNHRYNNIRIMAGYANTPPHGTLPHKIESWNTHPGYGKIGGTNPWMTASQAVQRDITNDDDGSPWLKFGATCWYFGQQLMDQMKMNDKVIPIGLINTAVGESRISWFMDNTTVSTCHNRSNSMRGKDNVDALREGQLFATHILPFVDFTIKGWVWYQGEHNMHFLKGNSIANIGYGCQLKTLIEAWRNIWSRVPNTTAPDAPFGIVTLTNKGGMGRSDVGLMRHAQTANYGALPNPGLPNTFLAQAYDLDDEWGGPNAGYCFEYNCCDNPKSKLYFDNRTCYMAALREACQAPTGACAVAEHTASIKSELHPRNKKQVGDRLGIAAYNLVYEGTEAYTGPTLQGCSVLEHASPKKRILEVRFNSTLLKGDSVSVIPYSPLVKLKKKKKGTVGGSQLYVQTKASRFCMEPQVIDRSKTVRRQRYYCPTWAGGDTNLSPVRKDILDEGWIMLNFTMAPNSTNAIHVDLSPLPKGRRPTAIRYAWGFVDCCDHRDPGLYVKHGCIANCPIRSTNGQLPANPFQAKIVGGKCECVAPQECNG